jgi:hypothetical protein
VQPARPPPRRAGGEAEAVRGGEARHVRLVDRDRRDAQPARRNEAPVADDERCCEVHHVRGELAQRRQHAPARHADRHRRHHRQVHLPDPHDGGARVLGGAVHAGCDDQHVVPRFGQVLDDSEHRVGDAVDHGEEALGDDRDAHGGTVSRQGIAPVASRPTAQEQPVSVAQLAM